MIRTWSPRQRLRRLLDLYGPAKALQLLIGSHAGPAGLPSWLAADATNAAIVVDHLLGAKELHLDWRFAPFWQDEQLDDNWPFVGAPTPAKSPNFAEGNPFTSPAALAPPLLPPAPTPPSANATPPALSVTSRLWAELQRHAEGAPWLWAYKAYFFATGGAPALLEGVIHAHELDNAGSMALLAERGRVVNTFAATLAIGIAHLEKVRMSTHLKAPSGYPSQWQSPRPAAVRWVSPLHGDQRFWDEFDAPPAGDPKRFVQYGLSRVEASRLWARRVALSLWADRHEMWPSRLAKLTLAQRRRLLGWDPADPRAADPHRCWLASSSDPGVSGWGYNMVRPNDAATGDVFGFDLRALYWHDGAGSPVQHRPHPDGGPCVVPYAVWSMNPYLAWQVAWHEVRPLQAAHATSGPLMAAWLRRRGFSHRSGLLARPEAGKPKGIESKFSIPSPSGSASWCVALNNGFGEGVFDPGAKELDWWASSAAYTGSLAEVLDANFCGCHGSASLCGAVLAAMNVPALLSDAGFLQRTGGALSVPGLGLPAPGWPRAAAFRAASIGWIGAGRYSHASLVIDEAAGRFATFHNDTLVGWSAWRFADPSLPWIPLAEWLLCTALSGTMPQQPWELSADVDAPGAWLQRLWAAHEARTARSAVTGMATDLSTWAQLDAAYDATMAKSGLGVPPLATRRGAYISSLHRTVMALRGRGPQDPQYNIAPQAYSEELRNALLGEETKIPAHAASHHGQLAMAAVVALLSGGPSGILPWISGGPESALLLRRACACAMGSDNGNAMFASGEEAAALGTSASKYPEMIPWQIEATGVYQSGDPRLPNRIDVTARWGDLPLNWWTPHIEGGATLLTDDPEVVAMMSWILLTIYAQTNASSGPPA